MQFLRNHLATIIAAVAVAALITGAFVLFGTQHTASQGTFYAVIHSGDGNVRRMPLSQDNVLEVQTSLGRNVIVVKDGTVRITEADCPKGSCTQQQPISQPGEQLICLPHQLWVEVVAPNGDSTELDTDAVTWEDQDDVDLVAR